MVTRSKVNLRHLSLKKLLEIEQQLKAFNPEIERYRSAKADSAREQARWVRDNAPIIDTHRNEVSIMSTAIQSLADEQRRRHSYIASRKLPSSRWKWLIRPNSISWHSGDYPSDLKTAIEDYERGEARLGELMRSRSEIGTSIVQASKPIKHSLAAPSKMMELTQGRTTYRFDLAAVDGRELRDEIRRKQAEEAIASSRVDTVREKARAYDRKQREQASAVKQKLRSQMQRDPHCPYCGVNFDYEGAHADHIYPVAFGGYSTASNMVFVCSDCNTKKAAFTLREFIKKFNLDEQAIHARLEMHGKKF